LCLIRVIKIKFNLVKTKDNYLYVQKRGAINLSGRHESDIHVLNLTGSYRIRYILKIFRTVP
jgi:hypothetical protein